MAILTAQALADLSLDELKTLIVRKLPIADKSSIVATRPQLIAALIESRKAA